MIPQIKEINFPTYATLSTATASLVDMGDKTITAQVKIDGSIVPDFSYDWEVEFQGERYIQPLREPQASKSNESINSIIDLTFYHKGIYDLKRYFFVSTVELEAGTLMADNYVVPLRLNIAEFVVYLNNVLKYYYGDTYKVFLNPDYEYDETDRRDIDINYTKIWDVLTKIHEWFGVRWSWDTQQDDVAYYSIKIGYPSIEVSHVFEYGFDGGLLKFERQVQDAEIANVVFGRGSSENIPFRYFKNKSEDNPTFPADPDWIPELENIYFANLRGKTFRDYVKGWKAKHYGGEVMANPTEEYTRGYNDETFSPIEYVKDNESIAKYGEIQKGLEHNEEIKPTIQGVTIDGIGRVDEIVDVEPILVDESTENTEWESKVENIDYTEVASDIDVWEIDSYTITSYSNSFTIPQGHKGSFLKDYNISAIQRSKCNVSYYKYGIDMVLIGGETKIIDHNLAFEIKKVEVVDETDTPLDNIVNIEGGTTVKVKYEIVVSGFLRRHSEVISDYPNYENTPIQVVTEAADLASINVSFAWQLDYTPIHGQILGNYEDGATRKSQTVTIASKGKDRVVFTTEEFTISENDAPATSVDMPYRITSSLKGGEYDPRPNVVAINVETGEQMASLNLPAGTYYLQNSIQIDNFASQQQTFKVELLPTHIYYSYESTSWKPTFDIWVKNIWQTTRQWTDPVGGVAAPETNEQYATRVWDAILGSHLGEDAKIVFSSGRLSGHSDYEFLIARRPVFDNTKNINGVRSEWRITLYKSDAEMETTNKWLPSIMTQASAGDHFYFVGIEMPHQYVLWAEERLDKYKREELEKVLDVDPTIVVQLDKVRVNKLQGDEIKPLIDSIRVGNNIRVADCRFIKSSHDVIHLQSVTYTWDASTIMLPNIEVVLSENVASSKNPIKETQNAISKITTNVTDAAKSTKLQFYKLTRSTTSNKNKTNEVSEQLSKAQKAIQYNEQAISDLDYLKDVFNDTEVMDEHAVVLSRLLAVTNEFDNVVSGIYGGGVSSMDDNGFKDPSHGTLMMFAGANNAQSANSAEFRVYSDGCIFANSGTFGGIMKRSKKIISNININNYTFFDVNNTRVLDLAKTGSFITFGALTTSNLTIRLPWYSSDTSKGSIDSLDDLLAIIGTKIIVNFAMLGRNFCFSVAKFYDGDVSPLCLVVNTTSTYIFECKAGKTTDGFVNIGWEVTEL